MSSTFEFDPDRIEGSGLITRGTAGEALTGHQLVYQGANGRWYLADADAAAYMPVIGLTLYTITAGNRGQILLHGYIGLASWTWTVGGTAGLIYASTTPGGLTQTAPAAPGDLTQIVGVATASNIIYFNPFPPSEGIGLDRGVGDFTYLIERSGADYEVYSDRGLLVHHGTDGDTEINWALTTGGAGCVVYLRENTTFVIDDPIMFTANTQVIRGGGRSSFIDGDALATGEHGIVLSGFDDCVMRDFSIQTQDGGTKTCHCIFIENGADRFLIENVVIIDSDDSGIRIEGTTINNGWIINCKFLDTDGRSIHVVPDAANYVYGLYIEGCLFQDFGNYVMELADRVQRSTIYNNIIEDGSRGIIIYDVSNMIRGNIIRNNDQHGLWLNGANQCSISDNLFYQNGFHGIYLANSDNCIIEGNECVENDFSDTGTYDGIYIDGNSDDSLILGNKCSDNDRYGINVAGARNRVKENDFSGNTAGAFNDGGTDTRTHFFWSFVMNPDSNLGDHPTMQMPDAMDTYIRNQIYVPLEFQELVTAEIVVSQGTAANPDMVWTCDTDWGKICSGEDYLEHTDSGGATTALAQDDLVCLDISGALTGIAAGDLIGVSFMRDGDNGADTVGGPVFYLGIRTRYV